MKQRLDILLTEKGLVQSRPRAKALIMAGKVLVNNFPADKPGLLVSTEDDITIKGEDHPYVSRGGLKLESALKTFHFDVRGFVCMDVGASTGGFTDCLLQHGAECVYAVDVGYGQLAWTLRQDKRVVVIERTNIRYIKPEAISHPIDLITIDVSFISLKIVIPSVMNFLKKTGKIIALIKPQFEAGKGKVGKGGVIRDPEIHQEVIDDLKQFFTSVGLTYKEIVDSPILGPKGNKEFLAMLYYQ